MAELMECDLRPCSDREIDDILKIINQAAQRYRGNIPADLWHEPYMDEAELRAEIADGVTLFGAWIQDRLAGVMGIQRVHGVRLIRHAYVLPAFQGTGVGGALLRNLCDGESGTILVGTWADAHWAIAFYQRHGFVQADPAETGTLLRSYWRISDRQAETSVVLQRA